MRAGVACALVCVAAASLLLAVPASASHHPPNSQSGLVSMTVSRASNDELSFNYTVTQQPCPNPHCDINFGKPYRVDVYVDAPDGTNGVRGLVTKVNLPANCNVGSLPLITCNTPGRSQTDPAAALPMTAPMTVHARTRAGSTAEIVVAGYSLNTYQEKVPVPPANCTQEHRALERARAVFQDRTHDFLDDFVRFTETERYTSTGSIRWSLAHDLAAARLGQTRRDVERLLSGAAEAAHALRECEGRELGKAPPASSVQARACTDDEWTALLARADTLKLVKTVPLVKKILAAQKAKQPAKAARLRKQLKSRLAAERKRVTPYRKAVAACLSS